MTPKFEWPHPLSTRPASGRHVWLRVLCTTDLHGNVLPTALDACRTQLDFGLARVATLVRMARDEAANTLLCDNGDFLQGTALSDLAAQPDSGWTGPNPIIAAMNALGYDAATLGNHEFNFGLEILQSTLTQARFPVICANAILGEAVAGCAAGTPLLPPFKVLRVPAIDSTGAPQEIRVGLLGLLPPQVSTWDHNHLKGRIASQPIVDAARLQVPLLRAAGAEVVIVLAHTGIGTGKNDPEAENAALDLTAVDGIDAIVAGHSHEVFPHSKRPPDDAASGVDHAAGALRGIPAVMAGFRGSHLGVMDLCLDEARDGSRTVLAHHSQTRPVKPDRDSPAAPADPAILRQLHPARAQFTRLASRILTHTPRPLHSYLALARCDLLQRVVLTGMARRLRDALRGTENEDLPVLAASAPFMTGGLGGPDYFTDIPAGPLSLKSIAEFYPFPNTLIGLQVTGHEIEDRLERAASAFARLELGEKDQPLWNDTFPGHSFDSVFGLTYRIDLSSPARFDADGTCVDQSARRIRDLCFDGKPVDPEANFALALNSFRAFGGGPVPAASEAQLLYRSRRLVRTILATDLETNGLSATLRSTPPWTFCALPDTSAILKTGPGLRDHPAELEKLGAEDLGMDENGFLVLRLTF
ncbi:bifunctional 2',3'-cyclic-nucleotide 2'-phosphodiesterase/3'-nucleotidase [Roseovarius aestuariivivens]|uniref:bifunctional 2',3'-cyclic-nucleotide 2'-phosphodiesterase/3'-nucleotidase n=1 Tax=Roseovarius aestuariivivens TaxID=1888910 RepID=UPI00108221AA|nr:bifunctional 2',3'-cyclic-nucleotide 2'-phosphodiesterase/3'-nucleotidase [Roseovarius aestuariivivens]